MTKRRKALTVIAACAAGLMAAGPAHASAPGTVTGDGVRVRSCPSTGTDCRILATARRGDRITIHCLDGTQGNPWFHVRHARSGTSGYIDGSYVRRSGPGTIPIC
ncbi:SH3 domain-containing protein [Streptomyces sp. NPDC090445]|uniref:SH3 domain-containing protein n=1 Tax=Streptomyces sp. NPDC090445 TaxID=3365963 RepID=UPI003810D511